jgi:hypothetical protein
MDIWDKPTEALGSVRRKHITDGPFFSRAAASQIVFRTVSGRVISGSGSAPSRFFHSVNFVNFV